MVCRPRQAQAAAVPRRVILVSSECPGLSGSYEVSGQAHQGWPVLAREGGRGVMYVSAVTGQWFVSDDPANMQRNVGWLCSTESSVRAPLLDAAWQADDGKGEWSAAPGTRATARPARGCAPPRRQLAVGAACRGALACGLAALCAGPLRCAATPACAAPRAPASACTSARAVGALPHSHARPRRPAAWHARAAAAEALPTAALAGHAATRAAPCWRRAAACM